MDRGEKKIFLNPTSNKQVNLDSQFWITLWIPFVTHSA